MKASCCNTKAASVYDRLCDVAFSRKTWPDEARRAPDVILDSGELVHSGWSRRADGLLAKVCG